MNLTKSLKLFSMLFLNSLILTHAEYLSRDEQILTADLIQAKTLHNVIFVLDEHIKFINISFFKVSSSMKVTAVYKYMSDLQWHMMIPDNPYFTHNTLIVYKPIMILKLYIIYSTLHIFNHVNSIQRFTWLVFPKEPESKIFLPYVPYDCQYLLAFKTGDSAYKLIKSVFLTHNKTIQSVRSVHVDYGNWSRENGLKLQKRARWGDVTNMQKTILKGCYVSDCSQKVPDKICASIELLTEVFATLNFSYIETACKTDGGPWDIMLRPFTMTLKIPLVIEAVQSKSYLKYLPMERMDWFIKHPTQEVISNFYIRPFDIQLWSTTIATLILVALSYRIIHYLDDSNAVDHALPDKIFFLHDVYSGQRQEDNEKTACRILFLSFSFLLFYIVPSYSADLTAYLSMRVDKIPFTDLQTFVNNGGYRLQMIYSGPEHSNFLERNDDLWREVEENFIDFYRPNENKKIYDALCNTKTAYSTYHPHLMYGKVKCRLLKIKNPIQMDYFGVILNDGLSPSPYTGLLNKIFLKFNEAGVLRRPRRIDTDYDVTQSFLQHEEDVQPIEFAQIGQILSIMAIGVLVSLLILLCEWIQFKISSIIKWLTSLGNLKKDIHPKQLGQIYKIIRIFAIGIFTSLVTLTVTKFVSKFFAPRN